MADDDSANPVSATPVADPLAHIDIDELADLSEELLPAERAAVARAHLEACAACREQLEDLHAVTRMLAASPAPPMPEAVALRLDEVIAAEQALRSTLPELPSTLPELPSTLPELVEGPSTGSGNVASTRSGNVRSLGSFQPDLRRGRRGLGRLRGWQTALVAAAAAGLVGFGGYVVSASSGLNEPVTAAPAYVQSEELGTEAAALARKDGLEAYPFTVTWRCAGRLVDGRITGLIPAYVDGDRALLVYSRRGGQTLVTVVRGCPGTAAAAGQSVALPG